MRQAAFISVAFLALLISIVLAYFQIQSAIVFLVGVFLTALSFGILSYVLFMIGVKAIENQTFDKTEFEMNATEDSLSDPEEGWEGGKYGYNVSVEVPGQPQAERPIKKRKADPSECTVVLQEMKHGSARVTCQISHEELMILGPILNREA